MIKKIIFIFLVVAGIVFLLNTNQCSSSSTSSRKTTSKLMVEEEQETDQIGWVYTHKEVRPDGSFTFWYIPSDYTRETEWFKISNLNVGYRIKADVIIEFQDLSDPQKITAVKHENVNTGTTGLKYTQDKDGNFSIPYPESELQQLAANSEAFRFRPLDEPMTGLKVSKVE